MIDVSSQNTKTRIRSSAMTSPSIAAMKVRSAAMKRPKRACPPR